MSKRQKRTVSAENEVLSSISQTAAARLLGIGRSTLAESDAPREGGRYSAPELVQWYVAKRLAELPADADMLGGDSPAMERFRLARAKLAELDLQEREKSSVPIGDLLPILAGVAGPLRKCGDDLGKLHGPGAQALLNAALQAYLDALQRAFDSLGAPDVTTSDTEGKSDGSDSDTAGSK
jgi:hypothetical protein